MAGITQQTDYFLENTVTEGDLGNGTSSSNRLATIGRGRDIFADLEKAGEILLNQYYHDYEFVMQMPNLPDSCLLYVHPSVKNAFELRKDKMTKADFDAMSANLLDRVNLDYLVLHPDDAKASHDHVKESLQKYRLERQEKLKQGIPLPPTEDPMERNPQLELADKELCDLEFDDIALNQKALPTLQLLKRPLYTELGVQTKEERTAARIARLTTQGGEPSSPMSGGAASPTAGDAPSRFSQQNGSSAGQAKKPPLNNQDWKNETTTSFKRAKAIDQSYQNFVLAIAKEKLGLDAGKVDSKKDEYFILTKSLLTLLSRPGATARALPSVLKLTLWSAVCESAKEGRAKDGGFEAVSAVLEASQKAVTDGMIDLQQDQQSQEACEKEFQEYKAEWELWCKRYAQFSKQTKKSNFAGTAPEAGAKAFTSGLTAANAKAHGFLRHPTKKDLVPLSVRSVVPSGAENAEEEDGGFSADGVELNHLVYRNTIPHHSRENQFKNSVPAVVSSDGSVVYRPVTDQSLTQVENNSGSLPAAGSTSLYRSLEENFVPGKPLEDARCSFVLQVYDDRVEYSRINKRVMHDHRTVEPEDKLSLKRNVVIVWEDEEEEEKAAAATNDEEPPQKRQRQEA